METKNKYKFDEMKPELPFSVPENYFENFAAQLEEQIAPKPVSLKKLMKPWMYMAAMFVGVLLIGNVLLQVHRDNSLEQAENYDAYVLSQLDQSLYYDYYFSEVGIQDETVSSESN